jgi:hypothetical protein
MRAADRRLAAWLCAFAVLVPTWLPLLHQPATLVLPDGRRAAASTGETVVICTAAGLVVRTLPGSGKAPVRPLPPCPICQGLHALGWFVPPASAMPVPPQLAVDRQRPPRQAPRIAARRVLVAAPRAPPASAWRPTAFGRAPRRPAWARPRPVTCP